MENHIKLTINDQLNPIFETIGLLYSSYHMESFKDDTIAQLDTLGLSGEAFYAKHLLILEKYIQSFAKHRVDHEAALFFFDEEEGIFYLILMLLFTRHPEWLSELRSIPEEQLREVLLLTLHDMLVEEESSQPTHHIKTMEELVAFLNNFELNEAVKWKVMRIFMQPQQLLSSFITIVNANLHAFELAYHDNKKAIDKLIQACIHTIRKQDSPPWMKLVENRGQEVTVYPVCITPLGIIANTNQVFYGVLMDEIPAPHTGQEDIRDYLLMRLKALSDNSKLQLVKLLKQSPKYNLELANELGITAATTSHHMNVLLAAGIVGIEKKNGKVYYNLDHDGIRQFIAQLEHFLL